MSNGFPTTLILTMLALATVLVVAWVILRGLAKMGVASNRNGRVKVVESVPLGSRERVVLIEVDSKEYLIGVSSGGVSQIGQLGDVQQRRDNHRGLSAAHPPTDLN